MRKQADHDFSRVSTIEVDADYASQRIDNYLMALLKGVPRSRIYRIIRKGEVRVNRKRVPAQYKLKCGDLIRVPPIRVARDDAVIAVSAGLAESLKSAVLYEDDALLVMDKPSGLAVHGGSGLALGLIEALRVVRSDPGLELMHRLDRETSGCLLVTKKRSALRQLHDDLRHDRIDKIYTALAAGKWPIRFEEVRAPLLKNHLKSGERMVVVSKQGKLSHTRFKVLQRYSRSTLLEAIPVTGRTHQIRVHLASIHHPVAGDPDYGGRKTLAALPRTEATQFLSSVKRQLLHAATLGFIHPIEDRYVEFTAPPPDDFKTVLKKLEEHG